VRNLITKKEYIKMEDVNNAFNELSKILYHNTNLQLETEALFKVSSQDFNRIKSILLPMYPHKNIISVDTFYSIQDNKQARKIQILSPEKITILQTKETIGQIYKDFFKIKVSHEKLFSGTLLSELNIRRKNRFRFEAKWSYIDLTIIDTKKDNKPSTEYEIEIESKNMSVITFKEDFLKIFKIILNTNILYSKKEQMSVANYINADFGSPKFGHLLSKNIHIKPIGIKYYNLNYDLILKDYRVTKKTDGLHQFLLYDESGIFLFHPPNYLNKILDTTSLNEISKTLYDQNLNGCMLEGELINKDFIILDCLYRFVSLLELPHLDRISESYHLIEPNNNLNFGIKLVNKKFYSLKSSNPDPIQNRRTMIKSIDQCYTELSDYENDGLVFVPNTKYKDQIIFKWKPAEKISIDFLVKNKSLFVVGDYGKLVKFDVKFDLNKMDLENKIVEFFPRKINDKLVYFAERIRQDKELPNSLKIANEDFNSSRDPISIETLCGKTLKLVTKYHRQIAGKLFREHSGKLLDIGSGRGGDLKNMENYSDITLVEPDSHNLKELFSRLENDYANFGDHWRSGNRKLQVIQTGGENFSKLGNQKYDIISMMLSLSFFFESDAKLNDLCRTICECSSVNTYFIFLTINGFALRRLIEIKRMENGGDLSFSFNLNNAWFRYDHEYDDIEIRIENTIVRGQIENFVDLSKLETILSENGFELLFLQQANEEKLFSDDELLFSNLYSYGKFLKKKDLPFSSVKFTPEKIQKREPVQFDILDSEQESKLEKESSNIEKETPEEEIPGPNTDHQLKIFLTRSEYKKYISVFEKDILGWGMNGDISEIKKLILQNIDNPDSFIYDLCREFFLDKNIVKKTNRSSNRIYEIKKYFPNLECTKYLDVGCSDGQITSSIGKHLKLEKENIIGVDVSDLKSQDFIEDFVFEKIIKEFPFPDSHFDLITCFMSIHHFNDFNFTMNEIYRTLKPDGILLIREHDVKDPHMKVLLDLQHAFYSVVWNKETETFTDHFADYKTKEVLQDQILKFDFIPIKQTNTEGPFNYYYQIFKKKGHDLEKEIPDLEKDSSHLEKEIPDLEKEIPDLETQDIEKETFIPDNTEIETLENIKIRNKEYIKISSLGFGDCFFHAVLLGCCVLYQNKVKDRLKLAKEFRHGLSSLVPDLFDIIEQKDSLDFNTKESLISLLKSDSFVGDEVVLLTAFAIERNIVVIHVSEDSGREEAKSYIAFDTREKTVFDFTLILVQKTKDHYDLLGVRNDDGIIITQFPLDYNILGLHSDYTDDPKSLLDAYSETKNYKYYIQYFETFLNEDKELTYPDHLGKPDSRFLNLLHKKRHEISFPYKKYYIKTNNRFEDLVNHRSKEVEFLFDPKFHKSGDLDVKYEGKYLVVDPGDTYDIDLLSDLFQEQERIKCHVRNQPSPDEYFRENIKDLVLEAKHIDSRNLREIIWEKCKECTTFRPTYAAHILRKFKSKRILDFSAGWGDRLLAAMSSKHVEKYLAYDPNVDLKIGHDMMIEKYNSEKDISIIYEPFQKADLSGENFDLIFTSPPYFDLEIYSGENQSISNLENNLEKWKHEFLFSSLEKSWNHLDNGGYMVIHISDISSTERIVEDMNNFILSLDSAYFMGMLGVRGNNNKVRPAWVFRKLVCTLEKINTNHTHDLNILTNQPDTMKFVGKGETWSAEKVNTFIETCIQDDVLKDPNYKYRAIIAKETEGEGDGIREKLVGIVGLHKINYDNDKSKFLTIFINENETRKNYAIDALRQMLIYGCKADIRYDNVPLYRLFEKLGFQREKEVKIDNKKYYRMIYTGGKKFLFSKLESSPDKT